MLQGTATFLCQMYTVFCFILSEELINETPLDTFCVEFINVGKGLLVAVSNVLTLPLACQLAPDTGPLQPSQYVVASIVSPHLSPTNGHHHRWYCLSQDLVSYSTTVIASLADTYISDEALSIGTYP